MLIRQRARAGLLGIAIFASTLPLWASPPPSIELVYEVEPSLESCPGEQEFRRAIGRRLGFDPFANAGSMKLVVQIRPSSQGIEGVVVWPGARANISKERRFASLPQDCDELARAMEFAITVQLEMLLTQDSATAKPEAGAAHPERDAAARSQALVPRQADGGRGSGAPPPALERAGAPWRMFVGAGPLLGWGTSPGISAGGRLFASFRLDALSFELGAEASLPSRWRGEEGSGFRGSALAGALAGCGHFGVLSLCGVGKAGRLQVTGFGVDEVASSAGWFAQLGARVAGSHGFGEHLLASLRAELVATPTRWTVELNRLAVWTMPSIAGSVGIDFSTPFL